MEEGFCLKLLAEKDAAMTVFRRLISIVVLALGIFIIALPQNIYAQPSNNINKNPIIIADKRNIEINRRLLKIAKESKNSFRIKAAKRNLWQAIRKMKVDKLLLSKG
jgi:hypothetical protein